MLKFARERLFHAHIRVGAHEALHDLDARHFEREDRRDAVLVQAGVFDDVHGKRGLAHAGTGGEHDEVGLLQAVRDAVEVLEPRLHAAEGVGVGLDVFELAQNFLDGLAVLHADEGIVVLALGDVVDGLFRKGDGVALLLSLHAVFDDVLRRPDERTVDGIAAHDGKILLVVGGRGRDLRKFRDVLEPARPFELSVALQPVGQRDDVDGHAAAVDGAHCIQDLAVRLLIEILFAELLQKFGLDLLIDEDTAEERRLRVEIVGHLIDRHDIPLSRSSPQRN